MLFSIRSFPYRLASQTLSGGVIAKDSSLSSCSSNDRTGDDESLWWITVTHIVILAEAEEAADLGGTLGSEALGVDDVGQAGDVVIALLDNGESEDGQVHADDAATDRLSLALTSAAGAVAGVTVGEQKADTGRVHDTLLHGETLLVVSTGDTEDVALEFVTKVVTGDLSAHLIDRLSVLIDHVEKNKKTIPPQLLRPEQVHVRFLLLLPHNKDLSRVS